MQFFFQASEENVLRILFAKKNYIDIKNRKGKKIYMLIENKVNNVPFIRRNSVDFGIDFYTEILWNIF